MNKKLIVFLILLMGLIFAGGFWLGVSIDSDGLRKKDDSYQAGWEAAKNQLAKKGFNTLPTGVEKKDLTGTIDSIDKDQISIKNVFGTSILSEPELENRIVKVNNQTKYYQLKQKDNAQFQKEMEDFQKKIQEQNASGAVNTELTPPQPQEKKEISLTELKAGQVIMIVADEDIQEKKEFLAKEITVQIFLEPTTFAPGQPNTGSITIPSNLPLPQASTNPTSMENLPVPSAPATPSSVEGLPVPSAPMAPTGGSVENLPVPNN